MTTQTTAAPTQPAPPQDADPVEALAGRLFGAAVGAMDLLCIDLGRRLGLYEALQAAGTATAAELAGVRGIDERYTREWLEQQAITGLLTVEGDDPATRRYAVAPGVHEVLLDPDSTSYLGPLGEIPAVVHPMVPRLEQAMRSGEGVPYADYGPRAVTAQEELNRPAFLSFLAAEWLPAMPDVQARLADATRPAAVADVGCGAGWSTIALAEAFPHLRLVGVDSDATSIARARANAAERGVTDRVTFREQAGEGGLEGGPYDLVTLFECLHDMSHPVPVLRAAREALAPEGTILVMDERAAETFTAPGDEVERFLAAASVLWCLPQSRTEPDSAALGTCLRPATVTRLAFEAGLRRCEVLPIEHPFWRFYRLSM